MKNIGLSPKLGTLSLTSRTQDHIKPMKILAPDRSPYETHLPKKAQKNNSIKYPEFKVRKQQNKRFDKIVSMITYAITSADKALKYVNLSVNF